MQHSTLLFFSIILFVGHTTAQNIATKEPCNTNRSITEMPVRAVQFVNEFPSKKEQFYTNWAKGTIYYNSGKQSTQVTLRYNGWKDELVWLRDVDFKTGAVIKGFVSGFELFRDTDTLKFIHYTDSSGYQKNDFFLQVLAEGTYSVYCYRKVTLLKGDNKFVNNYQYFFKSGGNLIRFKPRKSQFLSLFPKSKYKLVKELIRTHRLKISNDAGLAKAIEVINQWEKSGAF